MRKALSDFNKKKPTRDNNLYTGVEQYAGMAIQAPTFSVDTAGAKASGEIEAVIGNSRISHNLKRKRLCFCVTPAYMYGL